MEGWEIKKLKNACKIVSGQHILSGDYNDSGRGIGYLTGPSDFGQVYPVVSKWTESPKAIAEPNDIVITVKGSGVGKINVIGEESVAISRQLMALRTHSVDAKFLYLWLSYSFEDIAGRATGAAIPGLSRNDIGDLSIPLPPLPTQRRIVAILDEAFAAIDRAIGNVERNLGNVGELWESYVSEKLLGDMDSWDQRTIADICYNLDSQRVPITKKDRVAGPYPYYGASGIVDYINDFIFDEDLLLVSEDGANLLARTYPIAFSTSGKIWVNNHAHVLRFDNLATQRWVEYYLNSISLNPYVSGMAQPKLNQKSLNSITVPIPPVESQERIIELADRLVAAKERIQHLSSKKLRLLAQLKQSLLHQAFTGRLTSEREVEEEMAGV